MLIFSIYLHSKPVSPIFGHANELSSKYFTQIHGLFMPPRKNNNAAKFIVSLKQNSSEGFTINGFSRILSSYIRPLNFGQNALTQLWTKTPTSVSRKICYVKSGFQIRYEVYQFISLFWGNFFAYAIELIEFKLLFANSWLLTPQGKIYNAREITVSFKTNNLKGFIVASYVFFS